MNFKTFFYAITFYTLIITVSGRSLEDKISSSFMQEDFSSTTSNQSVFRYRKELVNLFKKEINSRYGFQISKTKFSRSLVYWMRAIL